MAKLVCSVLAQFLKLSCKVCTKYNAKLVQISYQKYNKDAGSKMHRCLVR